ncbi:GspE/PulE family protein [Thiohalorhabdus sp.]|uniref:GspE/PulE family protein n=1 Tax=Thiohalorhabdus sp. TaxID=3094134 RepID=UPI002FC2DF9D
MAKLKKIRLGDLLVQEGWITQQQLEEALAAQKDSGKKLGQLLIDQGLIDEKSLLRFVAEQLAIDYVDLSQFQLDPETAHALSESQARRFRAIPLKNKSDGTVQVGMSDPTNVMAVDRLERVLGAEVEPAVVSESALLRAMDRVYTQSEEMTNLAEEIGEEMGGEADQGLLEVRPGAEDAPVVRLLNSLFTQAIRAGASDIHVEPDQETLRIRFRIDGVMQERMTAERRVAGALVSRLKLMGELDIAERRLPQDGRFQLNIENRRIDVRLSTMPTSHGESAVMRLLDQTAGLIGLDELGMEADVREEFDRLIHVPHGIVLVTGPTGSGKTTTLYAALKAINNLQQKVITIEDPVEYQLPLINQIQVRPQIDLDFGRVLRTALRHDPDTIMLGEIRDMETASIAVRAALTGHMVYSTLHTNDAPSTATRLIDMGVEPFLVASSLRAVVAQRLVRRVCDSCKAPEEPSRAVLAGLRVDPEELAGVTFYRGQGCAECNNTGYRGRVGIYELMEVDGAVREAIANQDRGALERALQAQPSHRTLRESGLEKAKTGVTSLEEVLRVTAEDMEYAEFETA